jgi:hypothetical protein
MSGVTFLMATLGLAVAVIVRLLWHILYLEDENAELEIRAAASARTSLELYDKMRALRSQAVDANAQIAGLQELTGVSCPCPELVTNRDRIAYLKGRNEKLTTDALGNNASQYIKLNLN